jgi:hypothetical protein
MRSIVAFYEVDREYGGPEEGGWYFSSGRFVRAIGFYLTDEAAITAVRRANRLLDRLQKHRRSVESVLYDGGRFRAFSFTGLSPERFPVNRPHYE